MYEDNLPLYEQVKRLVMNKILHGDYKLNEKLPPDKDLSQEYKVSLITIKRALGELVKQGIITRRAGIGSVVVMGPQSFKELLHSQGRELVSKILSIEVVEPNEMLIKEFSLDAGSAKPFYKISRLRSLEGVPVTITDSYLPEEIGEEFVKHDLENSSFYKLIATILGKPIFKNKVSLSPVLVSDKQASLLKVKPGTPHFLWKGLSLVPLDTPVHLGVGVYNADMCDWEMVLQQGTIARWVFS
ncbi:MAG: GntR family transcriptional regulator [Bacteroidetes bacterium]|nr:GntR family transcriptional regulator [Bacteroidota bacterium]